MSSVKYTSSPSFIQMRNSSGLISTKRITDKREIKGDLLWIGQRMLRVIYYLTLRLIMLVTQE